MSEILSCPHFDVVGGLAPSIQKLDKETDGETKDYSDIAPTAAPLGEGVEVQAAVARLWDIFTKESDSCIKQEEYEGFVRRVTRVVLPGLSSAQELVLAKHSWEEAVANRSRLPFGAFYQATVRLAKMWTDSPSSASLAAFLEDLRLRISRARVTNPESGEEVELHEQIVVTFEGHNGNTGTLPPDNKFVTRFSIEPSGKHPSYRLVWNCSCEPLSTSGSSIIATGANFCWYDEKARDMSTTLDLGEGIRWVWADLDTVTPLGRAVLAALKQVRSCDRFVDIDLSGVEASTTPVDGARKLFASTLPSGTSRATVIVLTRDDHAIVEGNENDFGIQDMLGAGLTAGNTSNIIILAPVQGSVLYKLDLAREGAQLPEPCAATAAQPGYVPLDVPLGEEMKLPTFTDLLKNQAKLDLASGLVKPVRPESLIASGSLAAIGEAYISTNTDDVKVDLGDGGSSFRAAFGSSSNTIQKPVFYETLPDSQLWTTGFPVLQEGLRNDETDLNCLANTSPIALWVMGQSDADEEYKTEVCRSLAERLGLEWLQPLRLVSVAVKTPERHRTKLMNNVVEQVLRGMKVPIQQTLLLALEFMNSAKCRTNGYILDFPPLSPGDVEAVSNFAQRVTELSGVGEVRLENLFDQDLQKLPPRPPPPPPPKEEGEEGEAPAEGEAAPEGEAEAAPAAEKAAVPSLDAEVAEDEDEAGEKPPPPEAPLVPNPLACMMPRRLIFLSLDLEYQDEVKAQELARIKEKHAAKERRRKELEAAGDEAAAEEVPEEEQEVAELEEVPEFPEDEAEQDDLFEKGLGDLLKTVAPFCPQKPFKKSTKLPPLPVESQDDTQPSAVEQRTAFKECDDAAVKVLSEKHHIPLLRLHAHGRSADTIVDLVAQATGGLNWMKVPLPKPLEGAGDEPKECLKLDLNEKQASRRWSPWQMHCPVSLFDKRLVAGDKEFAVEYAGRVFLCGDVKKQRRFCTWPKRFLLQGPSINAPGMHLGYIIASPCGYRSLELANKMHDLYGFDIIDVAAIVAKAMELEAIDAPAQDPDEMNYDGEAQPRMSLDEDDGVPRLMMDEKGALLEGKALETATLVRLVAAALNVKSNVALIAQQKEAIEAAKKAIQDAEAALEEKPADIALNEDGEPIVELTGPLKVPERGFVLVGFPETDTHIQALKELARLGIERVLILKLLGEEAPEPADFLAKAGLGEEMPLGSTLDSQLANFDALLGIEGLRCEEVPMQASVHDQVVHIRKLIDPFYSVVTDPSAAIEVPDPDEWNFEEAMTAAADEDGKVAEVPVRPVIPWGTCGVYCPVTLKEDFWLSRGQRELQHVFENRVYAMASEKASADFLAEPERYVPRGREPPIPPPRIVVTGPTGSSVTKQCELLSEVYHIPVLKLEEVWKMEVERRLNEAKAAKKAKDKEQVESEKTLLGDDGQPVWPEGWVPVELVPEGEEAVEEAPPADAEPEDDGLDDEQREELFVQAMRAVLGAHSGACLIDGTWFGDLDNEEMAEEVKAVRSLQNLLVKARRLPDFTIMLKIKNDLAFNSVKDAAAIDKEDEDLRAIAKSQDAKELKEALEAVKFIGDERKAAFKAYLDELQGTEEEGPPDPLPEAPEDLVEAGEEKESDRAKAKFIEKKKLEQEALKAFADRLKEVRAEPVKVSMDRGQEPAHKAVRWNCREFMEQRKSLLLRHQVSRAAPSKVKDLESRALAVRSRFKDANPLKIGEPSFVGCEDTYQFAAELRGRLYFPRNQAELDKFLEEPQDFVHQAAPSRVIVNPAVAVSGPPLSGKTALARSLAKQSGAVYLSVPEVLAEMCSLSSVGSTLSRELRSLLRKGGAVPDEMIVQVLRQRITAPDVVRCGWVLDDFPLTVQQAKMLEQSGIVPHRLLTINVPEGLVYSRARTLGEQGAETDADLVQREPLLQRQRLDAVLRNGPRLRSFYGLTYDNVCDIDGSRSAWAMYDHALRETSAAVSQRLEYYRRTAQGQAAKVHGMCFDAERVSEGESAWERYCPVALTLNNELSHCTDAQFTVEYRSKIYWMGTEEFASLFVSDPESFLQVPLPSNLPQLLSAMERRAQPIAQLEDYCPVALVDRKELTKAPGHHIVKFMGKHYTFTSKEAAEKFMRRPMRYVQRAKLPCKRPALRGEHQVSLLNALTKGREGKGLEPADMLSYMQASVAELICQALVDAGDKRPLYPGKSASQSALLFLAKFLRAKNSVSTDLFSEKVKGELEAFLSDCTLPARLGKLLEEKPSLEVMDCWTSTDARIYKELCSRFDATFKLSP